MNKLDQNSQAFALLYKDNDGVVVGLDEVQLLDFVDDKRIVATEELLHGSDEFVRFQAMLVLAAWGKLSGMQAIEDFCKSPPKINLSPNRINGEDNCFDDVAEAIYLFVGSGGGKEQARQVLEKILDLYPEYYFESKLKHALLNCSQLVSEHQVKNAILRSRERGKIYQASQLLPVYAKINPADCWKLLLEFSTLPALVPDPAANVAEALRYFSGAEANKMLEAYLHHRGPGVAYAAKESIAFASRQK